MNLKEQEFSCYEVPDLTVKEWVNYKDKKEEQMEKTKHFGYRPLMDVFTIKESPIEGLGLFATEIFYPHPDNPISCYTGYGHECIEGNCEPIGGEVKEFITHYLMGDNLIRTPIGGFINHSDDPNCTLIRVEDEYDPYDAVFYLRPLRIVEEGEEITLNYNVHCMCGKN